MTLKERMAQLKQIQSQLHGKLEHAAKEATLRAIEKATELTPPMMDDLRGSNTRSGELKQHWATDSKVVPEIRGEQIVTILANNKDYASYVNDGHRMDRHFVPGLVINPYSGMLEYNPGGEGGIVVGTKTSYVPGIHMIDAAKKVYEDTLHVELKELEELMR